MAFRGSRWTDVNLSAAVDGCVGRQLCECTPCCCCRRPAVDVKSDCRRSLGVDYATYTDYNRSETQIWARIYSNKYDTACYKLPVVVVVVVVAMVVAAADVVAVVAGVTVLFGCVVSLDA